MFARTWAFHGLRHVLANMAMVLKPLLRTTENLPTFHLPFTRFSPLVFTLRPNLGRAESRDLLPRKKCHLEGVFPSAICSLGRGVHTCWSHVGSGWFEGSR